MKEARIWMWPWLGVFGGAAAWYAAHDLGTYLLTVNCHHPWLVPLIHLAALAAAAWCGWRAWQAWPDETGEDNTRKLMAFSSGIGTAAAGLFAVVILWQGIAALVFNGCIQ